MHASLERISTARLRWVGGLFLLWALVIVWRLVQLQLLRHEEYARQARSQHIRAEPLPAPRGVITDRAGHILAMSRELESVYVDPRHVPAPDVAARLLAGVLDLDAQELEGRIEEARRRRRGFLWIKRRINNEQALRLRSLQNPWIRFHREVVREYPNGPLAAHLIGAVAFDQTGSVGLEYGLDQHLRGRDGMARVFTDASRRSVGIEEAVAPEPGLSLVLTVDQRIQFVAERELEAAARAENCDSASAVVMDPETGDLLALASYPGFDPNRPPRSSQEIAARFLNHAVSVPYEPGSVFKIVTVSAALEAAGISPQTVVNCGNGRITLYGRVVRDHHPYAALSVADVLAKSSNIGAIQLALKVGERRMFEYVRRFGFGSKTGLPLPAESPGKLRSLADWHKTSLASIAMGHELSATTVQLARAVAVIANGGLLVEPRLILERRRPGAAPEKVPARKPVRVLQAETAFLMRRLMEGVVLHGTGSAARLEGYSVAGKTGTAQIYDPTVGKFTHRYNATFAGFAPVTRPRVVVVVTLNGARQFGGVVAAPVFRKIAAEALRLMNVPMDLPAAASPLPSEPADANDLAIADLSSPAAGEPETASAAMDLGRDALTPTASGELVSGPKTPDFRGKTMRAVLAEALAAGLPLEVSGRGLAREQFPAPGAPLPEDRRVRVVFQP